MVSLRYNPASTADGNGAHATQPPAHHKHEGRLNLLLSWADWRGDSWAERLPTLLEPMGVRSVRAHTGRQAEHVIRTIPVHIAVVDLGLPLDDPQPGASSTPSEAGTRLLELLRRLEAPPPTVVVKTARSHRDETRSIAAALNSGAFAVVDRSAADLECMLDVMRRCLRRFYEDRWPDGARPPT